MGPIYMTYAIHWTQHCLTGDTVEAEMQVSTDGGQHWSEVPCACGGFNGNQDFIFSTDSAHNNATWPRTHQESYGKCINGAAYRDHVYFANGGESKSTWTIC